MKKIELKKIKVGIDRLVTMAEMGLGAERPLNKEKRGWINRLKTNNCISYNWQNTVDEQRYKCWPISNCASQ